MATMKTNNIATVDWLVDWFCSVLHGIVEHDILAGQLQQHRIIEELINADVFTETLMKKE